MKPQKLKLSLTLSVFVFALIFTSCVKNSPVLPDTEPDFEIVTTNAKIASNITLQNGVLDFKSENDFRSTLLALSRMSPQEQLQWEEGLGFNSMQRVFNSIVDAEFETDGAHSNLYVSNIQSGLITPNETSGLYNLNLFSPAYAPIISRDGLVVVENDVYQFSKKALKIWKNGDVNRLEYLQNASSSDDEIRVIPMNFNEVTLRNSSNWFDQCESGDDSGMLMLSATYNSDYLQAVYPSIVFIEYSIMASSKVNDPVSGWDYDPNAVVKLKGKSEIKFTVTDGEIYRDRILTKSYDQIFGFGGAFVFVPDESGNYSFGNSWAFVNPPLLMRASWTAQNKLGNGSSFSCELVY